MKRFGFVLAILTLIALMPFIYVCAFPENDLLGWCIILSLVFIGQLIATIRYWQLRPKLRIGLLVINSLMLLVILLLAYFTIYVLPHVFDGYTF